MLDAVIVGSGPNGLAAAVVLARAGLSVQVFEANNTIGGGARTLELTLPGFRHDWGSAVHPLALASPFFRDFGLADRVSFHIPELSYAHPLTANHAAMAWRDLERTAAGLGADALAWKRLMKPLVAQHDAVMQFALSPMMPLPRKPMAGFTLLRRVLEQGSFLAHARFQDDPAQALLAGTFAHAVGRLPSIGPAAAGLILAMLAHQGGWPIPVGGSQTITEAMLADLQMHGAQVLAHHNVSSIEQLPAARTIVFDTSPKELLLLAGSRLDSAYRRALESYRYGKGSAKVDFALSEPVPWLNETLQQTGTLHLGGTWSEIAAAEKQVAQGRYPQQPYVLLSQPTLFDTTRAPSGKHTLWAYTHVPAGSRRDMTEVIISRIEEYAPDFREVILASYATSAQQLERENRNLIGGDIATGAVNLRQLLARPRLTANPWRAAPRMYLCSAATTPGPGVHGMGGYSTAKQILHEVFDLPLPILSSHFSS